MNCTRQAAELIEYARHGLEPDASLGAHLERCSRCAERWDRERQLTDELTSMRLRAATLMAEDMQREVLMRDFAAMHARMKTEYEGWRKAMRPWALAFAAGAAVLVFVLAGHIAGTHMRAPAAPVTMPTRDVRNTQSVDYEVSADASALSNDDFIAVPYTPPLAEGELVRVVHEDLYPEALARMGIDVDPAEANEIPADVVVGEDGIPRAVRFTGNAE